MSSHVNLTVSGDIRTQVEKTLNAEHPHTPAPPRVPASAEFCDRLAAAARERGRPLTAEEVTKIGMGETLPPVVKPVTVKSLEARIADLETQVAELQNFPVALRGVEKRGR